MSGNAKNTALWSGADVYIGTPGLKGPTDLKTPWGNGWNPVGLLDGEEGFTEGREEETGEHYAWGGNLFRRTRSKHKRTFRFVCLEDNAVTFGLVNPGSTRTTANGVRTSKIVVPGTKQFSVGFNLVDADRVKRRYGALAEVQEVAEVKESETDPTVYEITVVVFPDADGVLYTTVETDPEAVLAA
jgi:hypothetical protein